MKTRAVILIMAILAQSLCVFGFCLSGVPIQKKPRVTSICCKSVGLTSVPQSRQTVRPLLSSNNNAADNIIRNNNNPDPIIIDAVKLLRRASWFSWWSQVILTTIASVILVFAKSVQGQSPTNLFLSGTGLLISFCSIIWTWGNGNRLSRRLTIKPATPYKAAQMLRRAVRVGVTLNCVGLLCGLLAAQQIIGSLAIKVLTQRNLFANAGGALLQEGLQPLDVLVVQANTNALLSQFCSLISLLWLVSIIQKLDPPSTDDFPRRRS